MAKDSPRITAGELQNIVESRGQKTLEKNCQTSPISPHVVWEGSVVRHDCNFKWDWLLWSDETEK